MGTTRPTFRELRRCLEEDHGVTYERMPIFSNSEDGPFLERLAKDGQWVSWDVEPEELAAPSYVDYVCRTLKVDPNELKLRCEDGSQVSVKPPEEPPLN